jgi:hypothetical protein
LAIQEQSGRKAGAQGDQEQEQEGRATPWTSKEKSGREPSGRGGDSLGERREEEELYDPDPG